MGICCSSTRVDNETSVGHSSLPPRSSITSTLLSTPSYYSMSLLTSSKSEEGELGVKDSTPMNGLGRAAVLRDEDELVEEDIKTADPIDT